MPALKQTAFSAYAVLIRGKDGQEFLAAGNHCSVNLFRNRENALTFANNLADHIPPHRSMKVVKVNVTVEVTT